MNKTVVISTALVFGLGAHQASAEYIRATKQEEIILVSSQSEANMGRSLSRNVERKFMLDDNRELQERIGRIGSNIAAVSDRKDIAYSFKVLKGEGLKPDQRINAFALPGGYIYVLRDMVDLMDSDDEIAAILAHEVGHTAAKHSVKRMQGSLGAMAFNILASGLSQDNATRRKVNAAIGQLLMSYSREDESTADRLSVVYLKRAGYDPKAVIKTIEKMQSLQRTAPIKEYASYRSHPYLAERKSVAKKEIYGDMDFVDFMNSRAMSDGQ